MNASPYPRAAAMAIACLSTASVEAGNVIVALAAPPAGEAAQAPDWIKIAPRGRVTTRTGRSFAFDVEGLAARFNSDGTAIPVDFEHGTIHLAAKGQKVDAIGWIDKMEARDDGLYGHVDWLDAGKAALSARTHRYVSPSFPHDDKGNAKWFHHVALVTAPDLSNMPALAHAPADDPQLEKTMSKKIALALGLSESADETAVLSAIGDLKKAPEGETVPKEVHDQAIANLSATTARLDAIEKSRRDEKVEQLLEGAMKERRILPAQREKLAALCATDEGLEQVAELIAASPAMLGASDMDGRRPATGADEAFDPATLAAAATKFMHEQQAAGVPVSYIDALAHVEKESKGK